VAMLDLYHEGKISLEEIAEKMCHNVAILFEIEKRGYIRPGYHADLVIGDLKILGKLKRKTFFQNVVGLHLKGILSDRKSPIPSFPDIWCTKTEHSMKSKRAAAKISRKNYK
jgi:hypothetical protein